jgi:hypothetical protein
MTDDSDFDRESDDALVGRPARGSFENYDDDRDDVEHAEAMQNQQRGGPDNRDNRDSRSNREQFSRDRGYRQQGGYQRGYNQDQQEERPKFNVGLPFNLTFSVVMNRAFRDMLVQLLDDVASGNRPLESQFIAFRDALSNPYEATDKRLDNRRSTHRPQRRS